MLEMWVLSLVRELKQFFSVIYSDGTGSSLLHRLSSSYGKQGPLSVAVHWLLTMVARLIVERRL